MERFRQHFDAKDVPVARFADDPAEPLQFVLEQGRGVRFEPRLKQPERGAQPPESNPGLVEGLGVSGQRRDAVGEQMAERVGDNLAQPVGGTDVVVEYRGARFLRTASAAFLEAKSAGGLAFDFDGKRSGGMQFEREPVKSARSPLAQFQLEFVNSLCGVAGLNRAGIERSLNRGSVHVKGTRGSDDVGDDDRPERLADVRRQRLGDGGFGRQREVRPFRGDRPFPLAARLRGAIVPVRL